MPEITVKTKIKFKSWMTPNYVTVADGSSTAIHVKEADQEVLDEMAAHWLDELYAKAGKRNGWRRPVWR